MTDRLTLRELMRCPALLHSSVVLAEPTASYSFVCVNQFTANGQARIAHLDAPDDRQIDGVEGIWISSWMPSYGLEMIFPHLKLQGVGMVILTPSENGESGSSTEMSISTRELARKLKMSVVVLDQPQTTVSVAASLQGFMKSNLMTRSTSMAALSRAIQGMEPNPDNVVSELRKYVNAEIAIVNSLGLTLAGALESPLSLGELTTAPGQGPISALSANLISVPLPPLMENDDPALWILAEFSTDAAPFELEGARELMELTASPLLRWLTRQRFADELFQSARSAIVSQLAVSGGAVPDHLISQALSVGWNLNGWHTLVSIHAPQKSTAHDIGRMIPAALTRYGYSIASSEYMDHWLIWETQPNQPTRTEYKDLVGALDSVRPPLESGIVFGVARPRLGPEGFAKSIAEAEDFARQASYSKGRRQIVDAQESIATQLIRTTLHDPALVRPSMKFLGGLSEEDAGYLRDTLSAYLKCESSLAETARVLHVHRNTVVKRLEKIEQLMEVPLDNPDTKFALRIALRILDISATK
ncbi:PucR family transcriptional regulator [Arthrobacter bambusae]|uniref:PucR family transcriptional regulator n=1 Tax=Arthrobacter sp. NPDC058127 TaxID=3346351 RepID=UPI0036EBCFF8